MTGDRVCSWYTVMIFLRNFDPDGGERLYYPTLLTWMYSLDHCWDKWHLHILHASFFTHDYKYLLGPLAPELFQATHFSESSRYFFSSLSFCGMIVFLLLFTFTRNNKKKYYSVKWQANDNLFCISDNLNSHKKLQPILRENCTISFPNNLNASYCNGLQTIH